MFPEELNPKLNTENWTLELGEIAEFNIANEQSSIEIAELMNAR